MVKQRIKKLNPRVEAYACWFVVMTVLGGILLLGDAAWAQGAGNPLENTAEAVKGFETLIMKIMRSVFAIGGIFLGYAWTKGNSDARSKTEMYLVGLVVAFGITELINFFAGSSS